MLDGELSAGAGRVPPIHRPLTFSGSVCYRIAVDKRPNPPVMQWRRPRNGGYLAIADFRIVRKGRKYRTDWFNGLPRRISDGARSWNFVHTPGDTGYVPYGQEGPIPILSEGEHIRPALYQLPPEPAHVDIDGLEPLHEKSGEYRGEPALFREYPQRAGERAVGYKLVIDALTGYLLRASDGDDEEQFTEWSELTSGGDYPDALFMWEGPTRSWDEALALRAESGSA